MEHAILQAVCHDGKDTINQMLNAYCDGSGKTDL